MGSRQPPFGRTPRHPRSFRPRLSRLHLVRFTWSGSLGPSRDRRTALHHRPFIVARGLNTIAILLGAFPRRAETVFAQFPGALVLCACADRLPRHLAVGREGHLVLDVARGRREWLPVEESGLVFP